MKFNLFGTIIFALLLISFQKIAVSISRNRNQHSLSYIYEVEDKALVEIAQNLNQTQWNGVFEGHSWNLTKDSEEEWSGYFDNEQFGLNFTNNTFSGTLANLAFNGTIYNSTAIGFYNSNPWSAAWGSGQAAFTYEDFVWSGPIPSFTDNENITSTNSTNNKNEEEEEEEAEQIE